MAFHKIKGTDDRWLIEVVAKYNLHGEPKTLRRRKTVKGKESRARQVWSQMRTALEKEKEELISSPRFLKFKTLNDCLDFYLGKKAQSWDEFLIQRVRADLGGIPLGSLEDKFRVWLETIKLEPTYKGSLPTQSTINKYLGLPKAATSFCLKEKKISYNPLHMFSKEKENNKRDANISESQFLKLFHYLPEWLRPIVQFAYMVPTRRGELELAEPKHYNEEKQLLHIPLANTKTKCFNRHVPIPDSMVGYFNSIPYDCPWIFFRKDIDEHYHQLKDFHKAWDRSLAKAGLSDFHFHDLRGISSSRLQENKQVSIPVINYIAGWKLGNMMERYQRPFPPRVLHEAINNQEWLKAHPDNEVKNINLLFQKTKAA